MPAYFSDKEREEAFKKDQEEYRIWEERRKELIIILQTRLATSAEIKEIMEVYGGSNLLAIPFAYNDPEIFNKIFHNLLLHQFKMRLAQEEHEERMKRIRDGNA